MKQHLAIILSTIVVAFSATAQVELSKGIKVGLNFATAGGSDAPSSNSSATQYAFGAFVEVRLPYRFSVEPEVFYSLKGRKGTTTAILLSGPSSTQVTETLGYLDIPVLLKYYLPLNALDISVYAAPSIGFLLHAKARMESSTTIYEQDILGQRTGTDFGLVIGTGIIIPTELVSATLDVRYDLGLTALDNDNSRHKYNRVLQVLIGVSL